MNPYAWVESCDACAQISAKEKSHLEKLELLSKQQFSQEEQSIIESLRENGIHDPQTKQLLLSWNKEKERNVEIANTSYKAIALDIEKANLYWSAGFLEGALESLDAARIATLNENF